MSILPSASSTRPLPVMHAMPPRGPQRRIIVHHVDALNHGQERLGGIEVRGGVLDPDDLGELPLVVGRLSNCTTGRKG
jgi:hypothetical protein